MLAKKCKLVAVVGLSLALSGLFLSSRSEEQKEELTLGHVAGTVYVISGPGGNVAVSVGDDGVFLVDTKFDEYAENVLSLIETLGKGKPKFVINTHYHGDHTGGNAFFSSMAPVIAHGNVRKRLSTEQIIRGRNIPPKPEAAWPVATFDEGLRFYMNGEEIVVEHTWNTHTDGDAEVYFTESNVLHMGDNLFSGMFPFVDLDAGGNVENIIRHMDDLLKSLPRDVKIIPGHGPVSSLEDLKRNYEMLVETSRLVMAGIDEGRSLEQIVKQGLPEKWKEWSWSFVPTKRWIETVYRSYSH